MASNGKNEVRCSFCGRTQSEVKRIIDECYAKAKAILMEHRDVLDRSAALLMEKEKITGAEFEALFAENN